MRNTITAIYERPKVRDEVKRKRKFALLEILALVVFLVVWYQVMK